MRTLTRTIWALLALVAAMPSAAGADRPLSVAADHHHRPLPAGRLIRRGDAAGGGRSSRTI